MRRLLPQAVSQNLLFAGRHVRRLLPQAVPQSLPTNLRGLVQVRFPQFMLSGFSAVNDYRVTCGVKHNVTAATVSHTLGCRDSMVVLFVVFARLVC
jgi:hypothetical protein